MVGLTGEYNHTIDAKGRLSIPAKFRTVLGDSFIISASLDECLVIYTEEEWGILQAKLKSLPEYDDDARALRRYYGSNSAEVDIDPHGRILVPAKLVQYAGLKKDVTIIGTTDGKAEIWDAETWNARNDFKDPKAAIKNLTGKGFII